MLFRSRAVWPFEARLADRSARSAEQIGGKWTFWPWRAPSTVDARCEGAGAVESGGGSNGRSGDAVGADHLVRLSRRTPLLSITPGTGSGPFGPGATDRVTFLGWRVLPDRRTLRRPGTLTPLLETPGRCDSRSSRSTRSRECRRSEEISAPLPPRLPQAGTVAIRKKKRGEEKRKKGSRFPVHRFGRDIKRIEPIQRRVAGQVPRKSQLLQ